MGMELSREYYDISRDRLTAALAAKKESKEVVQKQGVYPR
jgi:DNA modification methylase